MTVTAMPISSIRLLFQTNTLHLIPGEAMVTYNRQLLMEVVVANLAHKVWIFLFLFDYFFH